MLLAIDTSTRQIGIAIFDGSQILTEATWTSPFHHTVELAPAVEQALTRAGCTPTDLSAVGAATGPGSFTALRSGLAFAKGLALAHDLPLLGIPSLDIYATAMPPADLPLVAVLEAGRKRLAAGRYRFEAGLWRQDGAPWLVTLEELIAACSRPVEVCGELNAAARVRLVQNTHVQVAPASLCVRRPGILAEMAWARWQAGERDDPAVLAPLYLSDGKSG